MTSGFVGTIALAVVLEGLPGLSADEKSCRLLDPDAGRRFIPDRVALMMENVPIDHKHSSAVQFPDKSRVAVGALVTGGMREVVRKKYNYILVTETRLRIGTGNLSAGMAGLAFDPESKPNAATRAFIIRDFSGTEIERITLRLDPSGQAATVLFVPKGPREFELRIGRYVVRGSQR